MDYKEVVEIIKSTDEILDKNPELREASQKLLKELMDVTGAKGGILFINDVLSKKYKYLAKEGKLLEKEILKEVINRKKPVIARNQVAFPVMLDNRILGLIYLYGKNFENQDLLFLGTAEMLLDGRFQHELDSTGLKRVFERYVGEKTMRKILNQNSSEELTGKTHTCTILFADVNNFTHFTNTNKSKKVVEFLNQYFKEMSKIVFKKEGIVDKFIGDAIMVVFGSPIPQEMHCHIAIETGKEMIRKMRDLVKKYGIEGGGLSVGIATGKVITGNVGYEKMMDYTVIGKKVNLASRLTSFAGKNQILVDESTKKSARGFSYKELEEVNLKGFKEEIKIYRVVLK